MSQAEKSFLTLCCLSLDFNIHVFVHQIFIFLDIYVYFFLRSFTLGSRQWTFLRITPFSLFGGYNPPPLSRPLSGAPRMGSVDVNLQPGRQAVATATAARLAGHGSVARGPRVGSAAADWPMPEPRLCGEPHKESRAGDRCRSSGAAEDEDREEQQTCPLWAGGAARRGGLCRHAKPCTGCALAEPSGTARCGEVSRVDHPCTSVVGCVGHMPQVWNPPGSPGRRAANITWQGVLTRLAAALAAVAPFCAAGSGRGVGGCRAILLG